LRGELRDYIELVERKSRALGIPSIDPEDGLVLYTAAVIASTRGGVAADLGAGIGYSTLWIAGGFDDSCPDECVVYAVESSSRLVREGRRLLGRAPLERVRIEWIEGDALEWLESMPGESLALAFVDIDKSEYPEALELLAEKLVFGGVALFHNAYWPAPPRRFYELTSKPPWIGGVAPTPLGVAVLVKVGGKG
jgi:predicted O-methyltransferase YrrM